MNKFFYVFIILGITGCAARDIMLDSFEFKPMKTTQHTIATWQKITNKNQPIHIYIEGDGRAFFANGAVSPDPTPHDNFVRDLVAHDMYSNVAYIARPCQFIRDENCDFHDWTDARFSKNNIDSIAYAIKQIAQNQPIVLIGYSGGAMASALVIQNNPDIKIQKWVTIAGVLNHHDWTEYFGDSNLDKSLNIKNLPDVPQIHYAGTDDLIVPIELSKKWVPKNKLRIVPGATHTNFLDFKPDLQ